MAPSNTPCFASSVAVTASTSSLAAPSAVVRHQQQKNVLPRVAVSKRSNIIRASEGGPIEEDLVWFDAVPIEEIQPGTIKRAVVASLDLCFACALDGQVYALGNKSPPLGLPTSDGKVVQVGNESYIKCSQYGTLFDLSTGEVKDEKSWIPSPPVISNVLRAIFKEPGFLPVYPIREMDGMLQVLVNQNARAQYEQKYWKGILDASGKADGGYY